MLRLLALLPILVSLCACGGSSAAGGAEPGGTSAPAKQDLDFSPGGPIRDEELGEFHVVMRVSLEGRPLGELVFGLWPEAAPRAVRRFLRHAAEGTYDGTTFHRVVREFVIQGGDPTDTGQGASPYGELAPEATVDPAYRHGYGVLSFTEPPSLQFFICCADSPAVWALDERPISRLGHLTQGVATLEQIANLEVTFGKVSGERSTPLTEPVIEEVRVVRGPAPTGETIQRPPVDLRGAPEVVTVQEIWITFTERAGTSRVRRNRLEAEMLAREVFGRLQSGELEWEEAVRRYSDSHPDPDQPLPVRRISNYGVRRIEAQRAAVDARAELRAMRNELRQELAAGLITSEELTRRQEEAEAASQARVKALFMERREDIGETGYADTAFKLEVGQVGLVEYDPYASPRGWFILRRVE